MGSINDTIWKALLKPLSVISDNVYIEIVVATFLFLILCCGIVYVINKKLRFSWPFGPVSMLFALSVAQMTQRLPMIHERMNRALGTTASIIQSSSTYSKNFETIAKVGTENTVDIVSYLYYMTEGQRNAWKCSPQDLYDSLFRTFDKIRSGFLLPDVNLPCFGTFTLPFILCILIIIIMACIVMTDTKTRLFRIICFFIQCGFLLYLSTISSGAVICVSILWFVEEIFYACFLEEKTT